MTTRLTWTLLMGLAAWLLSACGTPATPTIPAATPTPAFDQTRYNQGAEVYLASYCGSCHVLDAIESRGNFGPSHNEAALMAEQHLQDPNYDGDETTVAGYLRESILNPLVYFTPGYAGSAHRMPSYTNLSDDEIDALVYLLLQQDGDAPLAEVSS